MGEYLRLISLSKFSEIEVIFIVYLFLISIISFLMMAIDKRKAKNKKHRISESALLGVSLIGGAVGILIGMIVYRHKTSKKKFNIGIPILYILNQFIIIFIFNHLK